VPAEVPERPAHIEATGSRLVVENGEGAMTGTSSELRHDHRVREIYVGL
jgi:branched-chain amino acid transport system ATP-binding protein